MKKKIIICFTGEPRAFLKGLNIREKIFQKFFSNFEIETRYLISFGTKSSSENSYRIMKTLKGFDKDKKLRSLRVERTNIRNVFSHIIKQKYDILKEITEDDKELACSDIILTRTDWFFSDDCINLFFKAIKKNKVATPYSYNSFQFYEGIKYKPVFDQFMVIPGNLLNEVLDSLEKSLLIASEQKNSFISKNLRLGGDGKNRFGMSPENLLGIGFYLSDLHTKHLDEDNFSFSFKPDMYCTTNHNLIRNDAHLWMNLTILDIFKKYSWFLPAKLTWITKLKRKILNIFNL